MDRLLERAIAAVKALPEDRQEAVAARILAEVAPQTPGGARWAEVAERLARLDALKGESDRFRRHGRALRDRFRPDDPPSA